MPEMQNAAQEAYFSVSTQQGVVLAGAAPCHLTVALHLEVHAFCHQAEHTTRGWVCVPFPPLAQGRVIFYFIDRTIAWQPCFVVLPPYPSLYRQCLPTARTRQIGVPKRRGQRSNQTDVIIYTAETRSIEGTQRTGWQQVCRQQLPQFESDGREHTWLWLLPNCTGGAPPHTHQDELEQRRGDPNTHLEASWLAPGVAAHFTKCPVALTTACAAEAQALRNTEADENTIQRAFQTATHTRSATMPAATERARTEGRKRGSAEKRERMHTNEWCRRVTVLEVEEGGRQRPVEGKEVQALREANCDHRGRSHERTHHASHHMTDKLLLTYPERDWKVTYRNVTRAAQHRNVKGKQDTVARLSSTLSRASEARRQASQRKRREEWRLVTRVAARGVQNEIVVSEHQQDNGSINKGDQSQMNKSHVVSVGTTVTKNEVSETQGFNRPQLCGNVVDAPTCGHTKSHTAALPARPTQHTQSQATPSHCPLTRLAASKASARSDNGAGGQAQSKIVARMRKTHHDADRVPHHNGELAASLTAQMILNPKCEAREWRQIMQEADDTTYQCLSSITCRLRRENQQHECTEIECERQTQGIADAPARWPGRTTKIVRSSPGVSVAVLGGGHVLQLNHISAERTRIAVWKTATHDGMRVGMDAGSDCHAIQRLCSKGTSSQQERVGDEHIAHVPQLNCTSRITDLEYEPACTEEHLTDAAQTKQPTARHSAWRLCPQMLRAHHSPPQAVTRGQQNRDAQCDGNPRRHHKSQQIAQHIDALAYVPPTTITETAPAHAWLKLLPGYGYEYTCLLVVNDYTANQEKPADSRRRQRGKRPFETAEALQDHPATQRTDLRCLPHLTTMAFQADKKSSTGVAYAPASIRDTYMDLMIKPSELNRQAPGFAAGIPTVKKHIVSVVQSFTGNKTVELIYLNGPSENDKLKRSYGKVNFAGSIKDLLQHSAVIHMPQGPYPQAGFWYDVVLRIQQQIDRGPQSRRDAQTATEAYDQQVAKVREERQAQREAERAAAAGMEVDAEAAARQQQAQEAEAQAAQEREA